MYFSVCSEKIPVYWTSVSSVRHWWVSARIGRVRHDEPTDVTVHHVAAVVYSSAKGSNNHNQPIMMRNAGVGKSSPSPGRISGLHICVTGSGSLLVGMPDGVSSGPRAIKATYLLLNVRTAGTFGPNRDFTDLGWAVLNLNSWGSHQ